MYLLFGEGPSGPRDRARTTVVPPTLSGVQAFVCLPDWPAGESGLELAGGR